MTLKVHNLPGTRLSPTRDCRPRSVPVSAAHTFPDADKGVSRPSWHRGEWTREEDDLLRELAQTGASCNCIGRRMNRHPGAVYHRMIKLGITPAQKEFDHKEAYRRMNNLNTWRREDVPL